MPEKSENIRPIQRSVRCDCGVEDAFRLFTEQFGEWWPLGADDAQSWAIEPWIGGRLLERTRSGDEREWGTVTAWESGRRIAFAWHPPREYGGDQIVEVEFRADAIGTDVILTHYGWESAGPQALAMLSRYSAYVSERMVAA